MVKKKESFSWKALVLGLKRPLIALIATGLTALAGVDPVWSWVGGLSAERVWGTIEWYIKH